MSKKCVACGVTVAEVEPPVPPKGGGTMPVVEDPKKCPNCGKEGSLEDAEEPVVGASEEEELE